MRKLNDVEWFSGIYEKIYKILSSDERLPDADNIFILDNDDLTSLPPENVKGFVINSDGKKCIWFRDVPPDPVTFAHELIHCCKKLSNVDEEIYGYNLASFVTLLAEESIIPKKNPITLFEEVTLEKLLNAISEVYHYRFSNIAEYFLFLGVIPSFISLDVGFDLDDKGKIMATINQRYSEKDIVCASITELAAGAPYDPMMLKVLLKLLE